MIDRAERLGLLKEILRTRVMVLDGAMGTSIQDMHLTAEDFGGPRAPNNQQGARLSSRRGIGAE